MPQMDRDVSAEDDLICTRLPAQAARLYLFGSRARHRSPLVGHRHRRRTAEALAPGLLSELREALAESGLLLDVDLIDLSAADARLAASVRSEGIPWND